MIRIGHGYDTHCFEDDTPLILGGVTIPYPRGMKAHSDGDVLIHAVCDALLGAAALGDIGQHFPDTHEGYKNRDSRFFLKHTAQLVAEKKYQINNLDVSVLAQVPKLAPYILPMRQNLADDLNLQLDQISIKATTTECMGFVGRKEGIVCYAVALLQDVT